jgi:signal transduction histidine kinase
VHGVFTELADKFERLKKGDPSYILEKECIVEGKTLFLNFHFSIIGDNEENSTGYIIVIDDVTEEILIKKEKEKEENLSLIGKMLTTVIHDVKNPLSAIRGFAEIIGLKSDNTEIKEYTKIISREIFRLNDMTREILDFAKGHTSYNFTAVKISDFAGDLKIFLEKEFASKNINFDLRITEDFDVIIDSAKIHRAVINIAKNAAEAMEGGSSFQKKRTFRMEFKPDADTFTIKLSDNGPGIPKDILKKIFQPFYTRGKKLGTGLGLAIVEKMIADHKGKIKIWSEEGKGTVFTIILPKMQKII